MLIGVRHIVCIISMCLALFSCRNGASDNDSRFSWVDSTCMDKNVSDMNAIAQNPKIVRVQDGAQSDCVLLSDYAESVDVIPLESSSTSPLIGSIDKIIRLYDKYYVLDRRKTASIQVYSADGRYVNSIGSRGQGPGEYAEPTDFDVRGDRVFVLDQYNTRLLFYSLNGEYIGSKRMPFFATGISVISDTTYLFNAVNADNKHLGENINYYLYATDSTLAIKRKGFNEEHGKYISMWIPENFYRNGDHAYFHAPLSDDIYTVNADCELGHAYHIEFGDKALPSKYKLASNWDEFRQESVQSAYYIFPGKFFETKNYLCLEFLNNHQTKLLLFNKETNQVSVANGIKNDMGAELPIGNIIGCDSTNIYTSIVPEILIKAIKSVPKNKCEDIFTKEAQEFIHSLGEEDNPIIFSVLMK